MVEGRADAGLTVSRVSGVGLGVDSHGGTLGAALADTPNPGTRNRSEAEWPVCVGRWSEENEEEEESE